MIALVVREAPANVSSTVPAMMKHPAIPTKVVSYTCSFRLVNLPLNETLDKGRIVTQDYGDTSGVGKEITLQSKL